MTTSHPSTELPPLGSSNETTTPTVLVNNNEDSNGTTALSGTTDNSMVPTVTLTNPVQSNEKVSKLTVLSTMTGSVVMSDATDSTEAKWRSRKCGAITFSQIMAIMKNKEAYFHKPFSCIVFLKKKKEKKRSPSMAAVGYYKKIYNMEHFFVK